MTEEPIQEEVIHVKKPREGEILGVVEANLGSNKLSVRCQDGKIRICRIPGRFKRKLWIETNDVVLVEPWKIQGNERGDVIWKYKQSQAAWLRRKGILLI